MKIKRLAFGLPKLDGMLQGGIPEKTCISVSGLPGVGKSLLGFHFLLEGLRNGERCLYINLNETEDNLLRMIKSFDFGKEFDGYIRTNTLIIQSLEPKVFTKIYEEILKRISKKPYSRVVIDGLNMLFGEMEISGVRDMIREFLNKLRSSGNTSLIICEMDNRNMSSIEKMFCYAVDGMIFLNSLRFGTSLQTSLFVPKMRFTSQEDTTPNYLITGKGIEISD